MSSERKTRGRQRIPIKLIENKDDLLVSFSKRRVGVYKKASELSTLCGVDVGAIIFSPSGIPHSFFTPDFDSVVHGRRSVLDQRLEGSPRSRILELNKRLDEVIGQQEREEQREKQLDAAAAVNGGEMWWWEVPGESLDAEQVKEQIEWFQTLKGEIKSRVQELEINGGPPPQHGGGTGGAGHACGGYFFAPPSVDAYGGGGGTGAHVGDQYLFPPPPPPPPHFDTSAGGGSSLTADHYLFPPPHFELGQYSFPPASLDLFGGGGNGRDHEQYGYPPSPLGGGISHCWLNGYGYVSKEAQGNGEAGPSHRE